MRWCALPGLILVLRPANKKCQYFVTTSLIGWEQVKNQPWYMILDVVCQWQYLDQICSHYLRQYWPRSMSPYRIIRTKEFDIQLERWDRFFCAIQVPLAFISFPANQDFMNFIWQLMAVCIVLVEWCTWQAWFRMHRPMHTYGIGYGWVPC